MIEYNLTPEQQAEFAFYEVYQSPENPQDTGRYIGKSPILEQAIVACNNAQKEGKIYFLKGVTHDGRRVLIL